jgi:hypothetical protein
LRSHAELQLLIQLHIHHDKFIRRRRLLENRLQLFFARDGEAFGA